MEIAILTSLFLHDFHSHPSSWARLDFTSVNLSHSRVDNCRCGHSGIEFLNLLAHLNEIPVVVFDSHKHLRW